MNTNIHNTHTKRIENQQSGFFKHVKQCTNIPKLMHAWDKTGAFGDRWPDKPSCVPQPQNSLPGWYYYNWGTMTYIA